MRLIFEDNLLQNRPDIRQLIIDAYEPVTFADECIIGIVPGGLWMRSPDSEDRGFIVPLEMLQPGIADALRGWMRDSVEGSWNPKPPENNT